MLTKELAMSCLTDAKRCAKRCAKWCAGLLVLVVGLAACGGGGDGGGDGAPVASKLSFSPANALQVPGGTATVSGTIDFYDSGRNIATLRLTVSDGTDLTVAAPMAGVESGTLAGQFVVSTDKVGHFTFDLWVVDSAGQSSNRLSGSFDVVTNDSAASWRRIPAEDALKLALAGSMPGGNSLRAGVWTGSQYVAVGTEGAVVTTPDLAAWTRQTTGVGHVLYSVAWSGSAFVAVGSDFAGEAIVLRSVDGTGWTVQKRLGDCVPPSACSTPAALWKVIWAGSQFVAVGRETRTGSGDAALVLTSPDGVAWTQQAAGLLPVGSDERLGVASVSWSGSTLVAVGQARDGSAAAWTSADGVGWTAQSPPLAGRRVLRDVTWARGRFVGVGTGGPASIVSSADGVAWQANLGPESLAPMNAIAAGPNRYLALPSINSGQLSADGLRWTAAGNIPVAECGYGLLWDGSRWVAFGQTVCISP